MRVPVEIRQMIQTDIEFVFDGLSGHDVNKPLDYIERCWIVVMNAATDRIREGVIRRCLKKSLY